LECGFAEFVVPDDPLTILRNLEQGNPIAGTLSA